MTTVVHCKKEPYDIYIGRPSKWGNPFKIGRDGNRSVVIEKYREYVLSRPDLMSSLHELKGKRLGCWCVDKPIDHIRKSKHCHGEILLELIEGVESDLRSWSF